MSDTTDIEIGDYIVVDEDFSKEFKGNAGRVKEIHLGRLKTTGRDYAEYYSESDEYLGNSFQSPRVIEKHIPTKGFVKGLGQRHTIVFKDTLERVIKALPKGAAFVLNGNSFLKVSDVGSMEFVGVEGKTEFSTYPPTSGTNSELKLTTKIEFILAWHPNVAW